MLIRRTVLRLCVASLVCVSLGACAGSNRTVHAPSSGYHDPFESFNRKVFAFNDAVDQAVLLPAVKGYRAVVPKPGRTGVRNVLRNLRTPINAGNKLLQGDVEGFASATMRGLLNTTLGLGGLIDFAADVGLPYSHADFGQTLGMWGVGHGPYLVMPFLGPNSTRDFVGWSVDSYADPLRWYLFNTDRDTLHYARAGIATLDKRDELYGVLSDLRTGSLDYYAAMRSTLYQSREAMLAPSSDSGRSGLSISDFDAPEEESNGNDLQ